MMEFMGKRLAATKGKNKKGFTLIELVVVIAIMAILAAVMVPNLTAYIKKAEFAKSTADAKTIETAINLYNIEHKRFPRLSEVPYTSEQVKYFSNKVTGLTGEEVTLDPDGNYYDIDFLAISNYVGTPREQDKGNYILQNPIGKIYYLNEVTEDGINRADFSSSNPKNEIPTKGDEVKIDKTLAPKGITGLDDHYCGLGLGQITGVQSGQEYRKGSNSWIYIDNNNNIERLSIGNYEIRWAASGSLPAGESLIIKIEIEKTYDNDDDKPTCP